MPCPRTVRRAPLLAAAAAAGLALAAALTGPAGVAARTVPATGGAAEHRLTREEVEQVAGRLAPAGPVVLDALDRQVRDELADAARDGLVSARERRAVAACLERGACGGADVERGLDRVVDRLVTGVVEDTVEPVLEAVLGA
jgi:hypothetical protein